MASVLQFWHIARLGTDGVILDAELQTMGEGSGDDVLLVDAKPTEPSLNPRLWPLYKRVLCTALATSVGFIVSWAGSITSAAAENATVEFGVSETVESLATGLYFIGFGLGSLLAGPISETLGRNTVYIVAM